MTDQADRPAGAAAALIDSIDAARAGAKRAVARLVTCFEDQRPDAARARAALVAALDRAGAPVGRVIGVTGAPGVGKSTLVGALAVRLIDRPDERVAVVAVDPSSPLTGGALLGDRIRVHFPPDQPRLYFRSQAAASEPGGLAGTTPAVCRLLARLFTTVVIETVGVGQGEIDVVHLADHTVLVVQPHGGDQIQFMKAGLIEMPDRFVVNKSDLGGAAAATARALAGGLGLAAPDRARRPIHCTSALTGDGVAELAEAVLAVAPGGLPSRAPWWFERWVLREYGRDGLRRLAELAPSTAAYLAGCGGIDAAQAAFARA